MLSIESWIAAEDDDLYWLPSALVAMITTAIMVGGQFISTRISTDILENCNPNKLKEAAKTIWTNVAVTSALMLSLVVGMVQTDVPEPYRFTPDAEELTRITQLYCGFSCVAFLFHAISMLVCVLNLCYVEPLTDIDAIKYFMLYSDLIGDPVTFLGGAFLLQYVALGLWVLASYGLMTAALVSIGLLALFGIVGGWWKNNALFCPESRPDASYAWTQLEPSEWPTDRWESGCQLVKLRGHVGTRRLVKKLGKTILMASLESSLPNNLECDPVDKRSSLFDSVENTTATDDALALETSPRTTVRKKRIRRMKTNEASCRRSALEQDRDVSRDDAEIQNLENLVDEAATLVDMSRVALV